MQTEKITTKTKTEILLDIEKRHGKKILKDSMSHGRIEVWNYILCNRQNAAHDGVREIDRLDCVLSDELALVAKFFRSHGYTF